MEPTLSKIWPWTDCAGEYYIADASDLDGEYRCPKCGRPFSQRVLKAVRLDDADQEIFEWRGQHACGADLIIVND